MWSVSPASAADLSELQRRAARVAFLSESDRRALERQSKFGPLRYSRFDPGHSSRLASQVERITEPEALGARMRGPQR